MDGRIVWTSRALADLREIVRFISRDDPAAARRFGERLLTRVETLATFPESGGRVREFRSPALRELVLPPFRIVYQVDRAEPPAVTLLRVWHGARGNLDPGAIELSDE